MIGIDCYAGDGRRSFIPEARLRWHQPGWICRRQIRLKSLLLAWRLQQ